MEPHQPPARQRLKRYIDDRAADLRLTLNEVAERAGLTKEGLRGVRSGSGRMRRLTKAGLEDALQWRRGSVDAILHGGEPVPSPPRGTEPEARDPAAERRRLAKEIAAELAADIASGLEEAIAQRLEEIEERRRRESG